MASTFLQMVKHLLSLLCLITDLSRSACVQTSPTLPEAFSFVQSVYVSSSNTVYLFGTKDNDQFKTSLYTWDLSGPSEWVNHGEMLSGDELFSMANAVALIGNLVYFVGANPSVLIFNTDTNSWLDTSGIPDAPNGGVDACVTNNETHLFFVGGDYTDNGDTLQIYDIGRNSWSIEPIPMTEIAGNNYWGQMCLMHDNVLYVFGGHINAYGITANIYTWQSGTGWTEIATLPTATATGTAKKHALDDNIWIIGGWDGVDCQNTIHQFNIGTQTITSTYYMFDRFDQCSANFIGNDLYTFAGNLQTDYAPSDITQVCTGLVQAVTSSTTSSTTTTTAAPTKLPTKSPTKSPAKSPTKLPTKSPTKSPNKLSTKPPTTTTISTTPSTTKAPTTTTTTSTTSLITEAASTLSSDTATTTTASTKETEPKDTTSTSASTSSTSISAIASTLSPLAMDTKDYGENVVASVDPSGPQIVVMVIAAAGCGYLTFACMVIVYYWYRRRAKRAEELTNAMNANARMGNDITDVRIVPQVEMQETHIITPNEQYNAVLVAWFMHTIELPQYLQLFVDHGYDDILMLELIEDTAELIKIGIVNREHQALIMNEINKLRSKDIVQKEVKGHHAGEKSFCFTEVREKRTVEGGSVVRAALATSPNTPCHKSPTKGECADCGKHDLGQIYDADGLFYCNQCWMCYEEKGDKATSPTGGDEI